MSYTNHGVVSLEEERPIGRPVRNYQEENGGQGYKLFMNKQPAPAGWNLFRSSATDKSSVSERKYDGFLKSAYKALKLLTMVVVFIVTLAAAVVAKGATFIMVSQISAKNKHLPLCPSLLPGNHLDLVGQNPFTFPTPQEKVAWLWCIFFAFAAPEIFNFVHCFRVCAMKTFETPSILEFALVLMFEVLHTIGTGILFFLAFPGMDSVRALMATNAVCLFPGMLKLFMKEWEGRTIRMVSLAFTILAILMQLAGLAIWPIFERSENDIDTLWALPVGLFLTSFGWWECFVQEQGTWSKLWDIKTKMTDGGARSFTYLIITPIKVLLFFGCMLVIAPTTKIAPDIEFLFTSFLDSFNNLQYMLGSNMTDMWKMTANELTFLQSPWMLLVVQVGAAWLAYIFGKFACRCNIQPLCFSLPLTLVTPVCVSILTPLCTHRAQDPCSTPLFDPHIFFECPAGSDNGSWLVEDHAWVWILMFLSQLWITIHIWQPRSRRLAATDQIFGTMYYNSLLIEQSMMLNRRSDDGKKSRKFDFKTKHFSELRNRPEDEVEEPKKQKKRKISAWSDQNQDFNEIQRNDSTIRVMGCATMWHENAEEIEVMLKSIFRIDEDYSARKLALNILNVDEENLDYYEWESHVFFDDCMERSSEEKGEWIVNKFVRDLIKSVDEFGRKWYGKRRLHIPPPVKIATPYGGRLVWTLPGETQIICHLKDKDKIRHKKRWSQIMYMYYFLGHQLMDNPDLSDAQKEVRAENTFLLALDGDVDFQPEAIIKVVDLMKRNPDVGAACGRIHPTGSGYMQMYQKFEYALGHWLQKSTEHMLGCVLCSPGCFSLFRAKAVMDENVMHTYTTVASQPKHYVQYDQGEDRWLCTLMLKQGWRVEYSAASDSFTACPEGFKEFYNQRRRWLPSTLFNIADLIGDYKTVVKNNDDISYFYIAYQVLLFVSTIIGPGSIVLMLIGAFSLAFGLSNVDSLIFNIVIVGAYVLTCLFLKSDWQLMVAQLLTLFYAVIMIAVYIGVFIQITEDGPFSLPALGFTFTFGGFVIAAVLHPQEFWCLPNAIVYLCTIPSMYLLLVIYALFNLNDVSWGTREVPKSAADLAAEAESSVQEATKVAAVKKEGLLGYFQSIAESKKKGNLEFSLGNLFSCMCFTTEDQGDVKKELLMMADKLDKIEKALHIKPAPSSHAGGEEQKYMRHPTVQLAEAEQPQPKPKKTTIRFEEEPKIKRDEMENPYWIEDNHENREKCPLLVQARREKIGEREINFWTDMIAKYLKPLYENKDDKKKVKEGLKELKDSIALAFILLNSMWVAMIFMLQANSDTLNSQWPFGAKLNNVTFESNLTPGQDQNIVFLSKDYLAIDPIGGSFMVMFLFVMAIQLVGMLLHRLMTLGHIVSSTKLNMFKRKGFNSGEYLNRHGVEVMKEIQENLDLSQDGNTLEEAVEQTLKNITEGDDDTKRRLSRTATIKNLHRADTISALKRKQSKYGERKATVRRKTIRNKPGGLSDETIKEDEEEPVAQGEDTFAVRRTQSKMDPHGLEDREV